MKNLVNLVTPFDFESHIDYERLKVLLDLFLNSNVDGIVLLGDVSETNSLDSKEKKELLDFIIGYIDRRLEIYINIVGNMEEILTFNLSMKDKKIDCYIVNIKEGNDIGIIKFVSYLADKLNKNIIIDSYRELSFEVIRSLSYNKNIIGCIIRSDNLKYILAVSELSGENFSLYLADDYLILVGISLAFKGIISVIGNCYPDFVNEVSKNTSLSKEKYFKYDKLIKDIYRDSKVESIKYLLKINNLIGDKTRLPYGICSKVLKRKIEEDYLIL